MKIMLGVLQVVMLLICVACFFYLIKFYFQEGRDERGNTLLGKSSRNVYIAVVIGLAILVSISGILTQDEDYLITGLLALLTVLNIVETVSIVIYKKIS